jgi:carbon starvation protein
MVAVISLATVMMLATNSPLLTSPKPNFIYANGIGSFLSVFGVPIVFAVTFGLMAFTTFVYDTLDVCTRLGRFIIQELTGWPDARGRWVATGLTAAVPLLFVMRTATDASGKVIPVWQVFWALFGASNQLLAALTLLGVTVWLWKTYRAIWVIPVVGIPMVWMYCVSVYALLTMVLAAFAKGIPKDPVPYVGIILTLLAALMAVEAYRSLRGIRPAPPRPLETEPVPAAT